LDPEDWDQVKKIGYEMIDLLVEYHKSVAERPVWQPTPQDVKDMLQEPVPEKGSSLREVFEEFKTIILPYPTGNIHPRFWGWVHGTGTTTGALFELLAATMNPNTGGREHVANYVERQVVAWSREMLSFDPNASGLLTSGCSMANLTGLAVARHVKSEGKVRSDGLIQNGSKFTVYGSDQLHSSIQKAAEVLGLGATALRIIPSNDRYQIDLDFLKNAIISDIEEGFVPFAVVGNAGSVNTGAIDDFEGIANICTQYELWFHIDGAFGAFAKLLPEYEGAMQGLELADSIAFDMHKWMYMPYEIGCILVKHPDAHRAAFTLRPEYLSQEVRGLASFDKWPTEYGVELSRGFRALKAWMSIKEHGVAKYREVLLKNVHQARYLESLIEKTDQFEVLAPVSLNVVCFRYNPGNLSEKELEEFNTELLLRVQESGIAVFSSTSVKGKYALRVANTNQRSTYSDFDLLLSTLIEFSGLIASS
jgi:glutamate/tyrosine decarboxylase-like PLP-dependent enzyme